MGFARVGLIGVQMGGLLLAAISADVTIEDSAGLFGVLLGFAIFIALALDLLGRQRVLDRVDRLLLLLAAVLFLIGVLPVEAWWLLWSGGGALLLVVALRMVQRARGAEAASLRHRLGELTLIMLGEAFVKIGLKASEMPVTAFSDIGLVLVVATVTVLWWGYFTLPGAEGRAGKVRTIMHLPLHLATVALAVGLGKMLSDEKLPGGAEVGALVAAPLALALFAFGLMSLRSGMLRVPLVYFIVSLLLLGVLLFPGVSEAAGAHWVGGFCFAVTGCAVVIAAKRGASVSPVRPAE